MLKSFFGSLLDLESIISYKKFLYLLGFNINVSEYHKTQYMFKSQYLFNFNNLFKTIDIFFIIGLDIRIYSPIIYYKLRKLYLEKQIYIYYLGNYSNINFYIKNLTNDIKILYKILEGKY